ncbi:MAG: hypothetical protein QF408_14885, partial [Pirellulales bacterium]|nr:hypothetical protein [Pirellulales bacterium]
MEPTNPFLVDFDCHRAKARCITAYPDNPQRIAGPCSLEAVNASVIEACHTFSRSSQGEKKYAT